MKTLVLSDEHLVVGARGNPKKYATYSEGANNEGDQKDGVSFEGMLASNHGINYLFLFYPTPDCLLALTTYFVFVKVIDETLRIVNISFVSFRQATEDTYVNGWQQ
ncbi:hypothetical protein B296_00015566 [Ensete ventricosum]|uniref:Uncharacterized protein n=1 Tax=Ensete ventricosum TaxID=4639 RepID=A0A426YSC9_ENSVE|nr:hypothetical protein B296_00015566 [Ensete ventricosum]